MKVKQVFTHRLVLPIAALLVLILINTISRPSFLSVTVRDGQLYGSLIDILRNSAPLMLVALGMTIVIATRGIDLSVGALMAVSGAVALTIIDGSGTPENPTTLLLAITTGVLVTLAFGAWNGFLVAVLGIQPIIATLVLTLAGRGIALLITGGFITTVTSAPYRFMAQGYFVGLPFAFYVSVVAIAIVVLVERRTALGVLTEAVGINPRRAARRRALARHRVGRLRGERPARGSRRHPVQLQHHGCRRQRRRAVHRARRDPRGLLGGTSLMGGKFSIAGTVIGVFTIQTLKSTITFLGVPRP